MKQKTDDLITAALIVVLSLCTLAVVVAHLLGVKP